VWGSLAPCNLSRHMQGGNSDQWMILVVLVFVRNQSNALLSVLSMTWIPTSFFSPTFLQFGSKTENRTLYHRALINTFCWGNVLENWLLAYSRCTNKNCLVIRSWYNKKKPFFVTNWTVTIKIHWIISQPWLLAYWLEERFMPLTWSTIYHKSKCILL